MAASNLPPGFRFHPTDEELIVHYLKNQAMSRPCPVSIIPEIDIYKFDPWQLLDKVEFGENEWYFFTPLDRKYPNGARPNRATVSGYWKATGTDKAIYNGSKYVGVKKALVFYQGRPPRGTKSDWIMHEYRLSDVKQHANTRNGSMRLDDWVLCRIYKKRHATRTNMESEQSFEDPRVQINVNKEVVDKNLSDQDTTRLKFPRTCSLTHLLEMDYPTPISHLLSDNQFHPMLDCQDIGIGPGFPELQIGDFPFHYVADWGKIEVDPM